MQELLRPEVALRESFLRHHTVVRLLPYKHLQYAAQPWLRQALNELTCI